MRVYLRTDGTEFEFADLLPGLFLFLFCSFPRP